MKTAESKTTLRLTLAALLLPVLPPCTVAEIATSPSFVLQQATMNGGGAPISSARFSLDSSVGQESTIGVSSTPHAVLQSGFWSWSGTGLVPVLLMMRKNAGDPAHYDADWTGNNPPYLLYRTPNCADVFAGFLTTSLPNNWIDVAPPAESLVCYNVLATAPGPTPPPMSRFSATEAGTVETLPSDQRPIGSAPKGPR